MKCGRSYLRELRTECHLAGCSKAATHAVYNTYNAHQGNYCKRHAEMKLKLLRDEALNEALDSKTITGYRRCNKSDG